ncbi:hypothetical protein D3C74_91240 [compost metagenome]
MNRSEQKEILEETAYEYLYALRNSWPVGKNEDPSVYINKGRLQGFCRVFNLYFEEELRRKISFYKGMYPGEGKFWFQVVNESFTEEEAREEMKSRAKELRELRSVLNNL